MKSYPCTLEISESGKVARLKHFNGRVIAEFAVDGPLKIAAMRCEQNLRVVKGKVNIFRGELIALDSDEFLDWDNEEIRPDLKKQATASAASKI